MRDTVRLRKLKLLGPLWIRQKDRQSVYQQRMRDAVDDCREHLVDIGFGIQLPTKFDQRLPVVITFLVEEFVDVLLHPVLERVEQQRGNRENDDESIRSRTGEVLV